MTAGAWRQLAELYHRLGLVRFAAIFGGLIAWIVFGVWLMNVTQWPGRFDVPCGEHDCSLTQLWHSVALLREGTPADDAMFAWLWSVPAIPIALLGCRLIQKHRRRSYL